MSPEQLICRHRPRLADFPTEALNSDRGEGIAREQKRHLTPSQQNIPALVPVRTLSDKPCSATRTPEKFLLKTFLVISFSLQHEDNSSSKVVWFVVVVVFLNFHCCNFFLYINN